jgi:hypothetical protein
VKSINVLIIIYSPHLTSLSIITAWNDLEAIPRKESLLDLSDHGGSRRRLLFTKKEQLRNEVADIMLKATFKGKQPENYHRVTLITDPKVEND